MGDFRFCFKGTFRMGNVEQTRDMWLNYTPVEGGIIDETVLAWLEEVFLMGEQSIKDIIERPEIEEDPEIVRVEDEIIRQAELIKERRMRAAWGIK